MSYLRPRVTGLLCIGRSKCVALMRIYHPPGRLMPDVETENIKSRLITDRLPASFSDRLLLTGQLRNRMR